MSLLREIRLRARPVLVPFIGACLAGYFGYHAIQGDRGVVTWLQLGQRVEQAKAAIAASRAVESQLAHRVGLLRRSSLDRDLLDERARDVLNFAHANDRVFFVSVSGGSDLNY